MYSTQYDQGSIKISNDIIKLIACEAALEVEGVSGLINHLGLAFQEAGPAAYGAVDLNIVRGHVSIDIRIEADIESQVHLVAREVQKNIKEKVELMTELTVNRVNVQVAHLKH